MSYWIRWGVVGVWLSLLAGCSPEKKAEETLDKPKHKMSGPFLRPLTPDPPKPQLRVLVPEGHFPRWFQDVVAMKIKAEVVADTYATPEQARQKMESTSSAYDVVAMDDRLIQEWVRAGKLTKLEPDKLSGQPGIDPQYLHHYFDPSNAFVRPYACTFLGVLVRGEGKSPKTWDEAVTAGAALPGWSVAAAQGALGLKTIPSAGVTNAAPAIVWGPLDQLKMQTGTNAPPQLVQPGPRSAVILYHVALPVGGRNLAWGYEWIRQVFTLENAVRLAQENYWTTTQPAVKKLLPPEVLKNKLLYPDPAFLDRTAFIKTKAPASAPPPAVTPAATSPH